MKKAIRIAPDIQYKKYNGLAKIYMREAKFDRAEELLLKSMENYPFDDEAGKLLERLRVLREKRKPPPRP